MEMKKCELCNSPARLHCESDQASLCWDCDTNVHSANFLVANHSRVLLCHVCQSPTPWIGSGPKHVPTISVCENCVGENGIDNEENADEAEAESTGNHIHNDNHTYDGDGDGDDEDEENQVVPLSLDPTPPVSTLSNGSACSNSLSNEAVSSD